MQRVNFIPRISRPIIVPNVISISEERKLAAFLNKYLSRRKYEGNHWDDVIQQYKEIEVSSSMPDDLKLVTNRIRQSIENSIQKHRQTAGLGQESMNIRHMPIHCIDLAAVGHIGPHVDSVKFSGGIVASLSLLSSRILRLRYHGEESLEDSESDYRRSSSSDSSSKVRSECEVPLGCFADFEYYCHPRSLYILTDHFRYQYTHEILGKDSKEGSLAIESARSFQVLNSPQIYQRRISLIFRDEL